MVALEQAQLADGPFLDELPGAAEAGIAPAVVVHAEHHARRPAGLDHRVRLPQIQGDRLLAIHVDAPRGGGVRDGGVGVRPGTHVHRVRAPGVH